MPYRSPSYGMFWGHLFANAGVGVVVFETSQRSFVGKVLRGNLKRGGSMRERFGRTLSVVLKKPFIWGSRELFRGPKGGSIETFRAR